MATVFRPAGYTQSKSRLLVTPVIAGSVTAYLWGGGGGGGGNDRIAGGTGAGGCFAQKTFAVSPGDIIDIAVGGGGGAGQTGYFQPGPGGLAGESLVEFSWDTTQLVSASIVRVTNPAYTGWLNNLGVWNSNITSADFNQTLTLNFPSTGVYTFTGSADNSASIRLDGSVVLSIGGFGQLYDASVTVAAGNHTVQITATNTGGPGSIGLLISGGAIGSLSGGRGGDSGPAGASGSGGGGGGATVCLLNDTIIAMAGGGGGGGGGGNRGGDDSLARGQPAPGTRGQASIANTAGMNGQSYPSDGGGGGGGGGGYGGGQGGTIGPGFDFGGQAGSNGGNLGDIIEQSTGVAAAASNSPYYRSGSARGGAATLFGRPGYAVLVFDINGVFVRSDSGWDPVQKTWVKLGDTWTPVLTTWVNNSGIWQAVISSQENAPTFFNVPSNFGAQSRPFS